MLKYSILKPGKDFLFINNENPKGSRKKRTVLNRINGKIGFFKYEKYECSEACSEKLSYEIAKVLKIRCATIEFAKDEKGVLGIISYLFIDKKSSHTDAKAFFNANEFDRKKFCTINSIKKFLDIFGPNEFESFIEMMVFDALIGETDRHEENWGLTKEEGRYHFSPLYDNSCNLLWDFKNTSISEPFYNKQKSLENYIRKSKTCIYRENLQGRYRHFELIERLLQDYPEITCKNINKLKKLSNLRIRIILAKLPNGVISDIHKQYIYKYIVMRKKVLLNMIKKGEKSNEKSFVVNMEKSNNKNKI